MEVVRYVADNHLNSKILRIIDVPATNFKGAIQRIEIKINPDKTIFELAKYIKDVCGYDGECVFIYLGLPLGNAIIKNCGISDGSYLLMKICHFYIEKECVVCLDAPPSERFDCNHVCVCSGCFALGIYKCPICRARI